MRERREWKNRINCGDNDLNWCSSCPSFFFFYICPLCLNFFFQDTINAATIGFLDWHMTSAGVYRSRADQTFAIHIFLLLIVLRRSADLVVWKRYEQRGGSSLHPWFNSVIMVEESKKVKLVVGVGACE